MDNHIKILIGSTLPDHLDNEKIDSVYNLIINEKIDCTKLYLKNDWKHYVPYDMQVFWHLLSNNEKIIAYIVAEDLANNWEI